jgi:peptide/nickel transport system permease protein
MNEAVRVEATPVGAAIAPAAAPAASVPAGPGPARKQSSVLQHAVYVIGENPVTGLSFGLFVIIVLCAVFGPLLAPYDPLASNTAVALQRPSSAHGSAARSPGRDGNSRRVVARSDLGTPCCGGARIPARRTVGVAAGFSGWTDHRRRIATLWRFALLLAMSVSAALSAPVTNIVIATPSSVIFVRVARRANVRHEPAPSRQRGCRQRSEDAHRRRRSRRTGC